MRTIPTGLLAHKQDESTTLCQLIRIETIDGEVIGMTTLDQDVLYDDGKGEVLYRAAVGFQPASIYSSADVGVDNSEFTSLVPEYDFELNQERVNAGVYNYARFWMYEVNYDDLSQGHWVVMHGTLGQMTSKEGITLWGGMRSLMDQYRKPLCELDSLSCRAKFGSQVGEERFPCGYDTTSLWLPGTVETVGAESNRTFTDSTRTEVDDFFVPGLLEVLTGANAGFYAEVEQSTAAGEISLAFITPYPIQVGDTYRIRRDCNKRARDEEKGCKHWFGSSWTIHFRGEPDIPVGDAGTLTTPGAAVGPGSGGSVFEDAVNSIVNNPE